MASSSLYWRNYLFSFKGRATREDYWFMVALTLPFLAVAFMLNKHLGQDPFDGDGIFVMLPMLWPSLAVSARRWHDRDKSAWWLLMNLVPLIGGFWTLVENGFLKGTVGSNRYGPDLIESET